MDWEGFNMPAGKISIRRLKVLARKHKKLVRRKNHLRCRTFESPMGRERRLANGK